MQVEQYVMAYGIEQDRIRAIIPEGFVSLRPVLRINAEIQDNSNGYLEFNTPVEKDNAGCYFLKETPVPATIRSHYELLEHKASECIGCQECETRCPFGVPIAERMEKTAKLFGC